MKKICRTIALILCAVMLLSASAMAAGKEITIKDIVISMGEEMTLDLSGVGLNLGFADAEGGVGMHLGLAANDASAADIQACIQEGKLLLGADGISKVYSLDLMSVLAQTGIPMNGFSFSEADEQALAALAETAMIALMTSITPGEPVEIDGVAYETYNINLSADKIDSVLAALAVLLDAHPELFAQSEYENFSAMLADMDGKFSVEGYAQISENEFKAHIYPIVTSADGEAMSDDKPLIVVEGASDADASVIVLTFAEEDEAGEIEDEFYMNLVAQHMGGEFGAFEFYAMSADDETEGLYLCLMAPGTSETGKWNFVFGSLDGSVAIEADCVMAEGSVVLSTEGDYMAFAYAVDNGEGAYSFVMNADGTEVSIDASSTVTDGDGAWMIPAGVETIDIMSITDEQLNALSMEAMSVGLGALAQLASANETIAMLASSMMG